MRVQILRKLDGKVALITGSTRGIGRATALLLAEHGARVVLNYKKSEADAAQVKREVAEVAEVEPLVFRADVTDATQFRSMVDHVLKECGTLDILVNNADDDQFVFSDPRSISEEKWRLIIQGALYSVYYGCKYAIEVMKKQGDGRIVNIAAVGDQDCELAAACLPYYIAKEGVRRATKVLAAREAANNIAINSISPGYLNNFQYDDDFASFVKKRIPSGRLGTPQEVANAVLFLVSPEITYITGEDIIVAGGI